MMNYAVTSTDDVMLQRYLERARERIENALSRYLPEASDIDAASSPGRLVSAMRYSTLGAGKRLRAILCLMAADACGGKNEAALPAACAIELVHAYSLIHDDLPAMDNDDFRRGRLSCHRAFDEATAILAGDGLLTLAFELLAGEIKPGAVALRCVAILAESAGRIGMVGGQMADLQVQDHNTQDYRDSDVKMSEELLTLESIHARKTAALLRAALRMGASVAGAPEAYIEVLDRYGKAIGLAFQIVDDVLDVEGEESKLGKRVGKDFALGKWTYPGLLGLDKSRRLAQMLVDEAAQMILPFGAPGNNLRNLALALLERDR
jgi:geranylgeranyl diphosphate synthase, type II